MVKIEILEKDIEECLLHLEYLNKVLIIQNEIKIFTSDNNINMIDLNIDNIHPIVTVAQLEVSLVLKSIHFSKNDEERSHIIKKGLLIVYETFQTLNNYNIVFKKYSEKNTNLKNDFEKINDILKGFKKNINSNARIKDIRNNTAAHINPNFLEYYRNIKKINIDDDLHLIISMRVVLNELNKYLYNCIHTDIRENITKN